MEKTTKKAKKQANKLTKNQIKWAKLDTQIYENSLNTNDIWTTILDEVF